MAVGISLVVVLLVCWGGHWTHEQALTASITVGRADVPGFTPGDPTEFRAASGRHVFTCSSSGGTGSGPTYLWSSTCVGCPFIGATAAVISRGAVASYDTGTHTCTVTRGGETAMDTTVVNVVGAGIQIFTGTSDPLFPDAQVSVANNALVIARENLAGDFRLRIACRSDSIMESSTRQIIGRNGNIIETAGPFLIEHSLLGEITIFNTNTEPAVVTSNDQGIYTCRIQLQNGETRDINIGIYPFNFDTQPVITNPLMYTPGSPSSLTCISTGSPATTVTFTRVGTDDIGPLRDGESATVGGVLYQLAQTVTSRTQSTYENVLTINEPQSTLTGNTFTCTVENTLGTATSQSFQIPAPLTVGIAVAYIPPPGSTPGPNEYRAASGPVEVTCTASGGAGSGPTYQWSSTCAGCVFREGTSESRDRIITRTSVRSADMGTHTCTATRGGESASMNIVFTVVGAGIHVIEGASNTVGPQPNNGLVVSDDPGSGGRIDFICRSNSLILSVGELIGLDGNAFSGNTFLGLNNPTSELRIENTVGTEQPLPASEQGIYTCRISLENGDLRMINIGVYPIGFNTQPTVNDPLVFTPGSPSSLTCTSTGSPATTVTFRRGSTDIGPLRDGEPVTVGGVDYQLAQTVTSRTQSTYQNMLTINEPLDSLVDASFTCTVENTLGSSTSSNPITIQAIEFARSPPTVTVGDTVTYTCTSVLGTATIAWLDTADGNAELETDSGVTELNLVLNRIPQSMDDRVYTCRVTLGGTPTTRDLTVEIQAPSVTATIAVSGPRVVGGDIILTCSVDGLNSLASDTTIEFRGPRDDMGSGSTSFQLSLNPAQFSDDGQYMCIATVSSTLLNNDVTVTDTDTVTLDLRISNPQVEITRNGGTPLYAGIVLTLTCRITVVGVPANMLSSVVVTRTWRGTGGGDLSGLTNSRITVSSIMLDSGTTYTSTTVFNTLDTSNMGRYTCEANIVSTVSSVEGSEIVEGEITLNIELPTLTLSVVPSTTRLPDIAPYNTFNVTCIATAPEGVILAKAFVWRRANAADGSCTDFPVVADNIMDSNLNQAVSTSILNVTETAIATLRFCCQASITELSVSGTPNNVSSIEIVGPAPPMPPTNVRIVSAGATTATVAWTVPLIVYTPETYVVSYSTSTAKRQVLMSDQVESGADFDAVNQMFSVNLIELEPSTAYTYQVLSENSEDSSTSETQSLTTTSDTSCDANSTIVGGVLGAVVGLLLAYGILTTIVIVVLLRRHHHAGVSLHQHGMEQPVKWSTVTKLEDSDIQTDTCVAYGQVQQPLPTDRALDSTYEVIQGETQ